MMVEASCLTERLGHTHVLDATYMHVRNSQKITVLFEIWILLGRLGL